MFLGKNGSDAGYVVSYRHSPLYNLIVSVIRETTKV